MAITLTTTPSAHVAAFAPVLIAGTSSRNPFTGSVRESKSCGTYSNDGSGYTKILVTSGTDWEASDTIAISGSSIADGNHSVKSVAAGYIILWTTWATWATTPTGGTAYRMNQGLNIRIEVENDSAEVIATLYANVNTEDDSWSLDISRALQYELASMFDLTAGENETSGWSHDYTLNLYETFLSDTYTQTEVAHATHPTTIAHRMTELGDGNTLTMGGGFHNGSIPVHYYQSTSGLDIKLRFIEADGTTTNTALLTEGNGHFSYTFESTEDWVSVAAYDYTDVPEGVALTPPVYIKKIGCASVLLYFLNRYGDYQGYEFPMVEDVQKATKVNKYTGEAWKERTLIGRQYINGTYQNIRDVVTSPEVYDEDGTAVRVLTDSLMYNAEKVDPTITIRYDETFIQ